MSKPSTNSVSIDLEVDPRRGGRPSCGFSLMEMLVVISLITLLMSLLMPALGKSREYARRTACATNSRSQVQACDTYSVDHADFLPPSQNQSGSIVAYSFDIKSFHDPKIPLGVGIALAKGYFNFQPNALHCPSLDTSGATAYNTPYHSMDVDAPNWWNGVGASYWDDPAHATKRIIIGYTYRSPSYWRANTTERFLRVSTSPSYTVVNADILDPRFGRQYAHIQGYNFTRMDESGDWHPDPKGELEQIVLNFGTSVVDGINTPVTDEIIFKELEEGG